MKLADAARQRNRRACVCVRASGFCAVLLLGSAAALADEPAPQPPSPRAPAPRVTPTMPTPFDGLGVDLASAFTGLNLLWYGGAVAATGAMAFGGLDQAVRVGV